MFYNRVVDQPALFSRPRRPDVEQGQLFELRRTIFDTPELRGLEFIEVEARTVLNHVPGDRLPFSWTINPYRGCSHACVYCFARATHTFLDMNPGRDFETKIVVKVNAAQVLRAQLARKSWKGEHVAMGTNTDPYQAAEGKYRLMPGILRALRDFRNPFSILTKGTMILRDLDLLLEAAAVTDVHTSLSIGTIDEDAWRRTEPGTPDPRKRLEAVRRLNAAGIPCGVLMAPILPGITDDIDLLRRTAAAAIEAGATHVHPILLHLRPRVKEEFMAWLGREQPAMVERYEAMYRNRAYAAGADQRELAEKMKEVLGELPAPTPSVSRFSPERRRWTGRVDSQPSPNAEQLSLV
jgi:DNA repair photolyase